MDDSQCQNQLSPTPEKPTLKSKKNLNEKEHSVISNYNMPLQSQLQNFMGGSSKQSSKVKPYGHYDSGTVLCGGASDAIFKQHN